MASCLECSQTLKIKPPHPPHRALPTPRQSFQHTLRSPQQQRSTSRHCAATRADTPLATTTSTSTPHHTGPCELQSRTGDPRPRLHGRRGGACEPPRARGAPAATPRPRALPVQVFAPSTIAVFGSTTPRVATPDETVCEPSTMYGITKVHVELLGKYYADKFGVDFRACAIPASSRPRRRPAGGTTDYTVEMYIVRLAVSSMCARLRMDGVPLAWCGRTPAWRICALAHRSHSHRCLKSVRTAREQGGACELLNTASRASSPPRARGVKAAGSTTPRTAGGGAGQRLRVPHPPGHAAADDVHAGLPACHVEAHHRAPPGALALHLQRHRHVLHARTARGEHPHLLPCLPGAPPPLNPRLSLPCACAQASVPRCMPRGPALVVCGARRTPGHSRWCVRRCRRRFHVCRRCRCAACVDSSAFCSSAGLGGRSAASVAGEQPAGASAAELSEPSR